MKRSKRKTSAARVTVHTQRRPHPPGVSRATTRRLGLVVLWVGSFAGIAYGLHRLEGYTRDADHTGRWRLEWADVPPTVDDWILDEIEDESQLYDLRPLFAADVHAPDLCAGVGTALAKSPWIAEVERVVKRADGVVSVQASFRTYLTYLVRNRMGYLVDETGVRLPRQEAAAYLPRYEMIVVEGVQAPVPAVGQPWDDEAVAGGLKLVKFLEKHCPPGLRGALRAVDVSNYHNRRNARDGWLSIRTIRPGSYVRWGLPPGEEYDIESTAERKLELLWSYYAQHGQLADADVIDVRRQDEVLHWSTP